MSARNIQIIDGVPCRLFAGEHWMEYAVAAEYTGCTLGYIRDLASQGKIRTRRAGKTAEVAKISLDRQFGGSVAA